MMKTLEFLSHLRSLNVSLRVENGGLQVSAPKESLTPELIEQLSARKPEILALLTNSARNGSVLRPIERLPRDQADSFALSFAQLRLWFLDQLTPGSAAYNIAVAVRLRGELDASALQRSVDGIVQRHEVLRTVFKQTDGWPSQVILPPAPVPIPTVDLTHLSPDLRESKALALAAAEAQKPFALAKGPLFRAQLLRLGGQDHVFQFTVHHAVFDGWSIGVFFQNFTALYRAFREDKPSPLRELPVQYVDFAAWQKRVLEGTERESHLAYWREQLGGDLPTLELPTDRPRGDVRVSRAARKTLTVSPSLCRSLRSLSQREGASLSMTLLAAFTILLHRLSGQDDILVGTPIAGRTRTEVEEMIGFFVNTIVVRSAFFDSLSFRDHLSRIRKTMLEAHEHQDMPFEELVGALDPHRDLDQTPLFRVFFNHLNLQVKPVQLDGLQVEPFGDFELDSKFDLTLYVREQEDSIGFILTYNTDLFDEDRISILLDQYEGLLEQICEDSLRQVDRYSLLTASTSCRVPNPVEPLESRWYGSVQSRFLERAALNPDRVAVKEEGAQWTYGELERLSSGLAAWLQAQGVGPEDTVAVYGHRSAPLVLALLGVLRAGAAFSIFDPAYPAARLARCLRQIQPKAWVRIAAAGDPPAALQNVIDEMNLSRLTLPDAQQALSLPELRARLGSSEDVNPDSLAYLTFTSGTTGEPKCILGTHRPLSHFVDWHVREFGLKFSDRFTMLSGLAHDPLLRDVFTPLWLGATLCIPRADSMLSPAWLSGWMREQQISVAHLTPALGAVLSDPAGGRTSDVAGTPVSELRYLFFGGDVLTPRDVARVLTVAPQAQCVNFYGTTETPQAMACYRINPAQVDSQHDVEAVRRPISLGRAIDDAQVLVINQAGGPAGIGELGEIQIRTPYLSRGYLNDGDLTAQRFIPNPLTSEDGDRLYRTGDLGRYRPDGLIDFAGRADRQLKIRGYRIEPEEIETALTRYPGVRDCMVLARDDRWGGKQLAAYLTAADGRPIAHEGLRAYLQGLLPEHMIPSVFVVLDRMPLTPNGKVDRHALALLGEDGAEPARAYVLPSNHVERVMATIWSEVLGIESSKIGVSDNFFELGGHSLTATRIIARLRSAFEIDLPLRSIFLEPTIASLSKHIRYSTLTGVYQYFSEIPRWNYLIPTQPRGTRRPLFLVAGHSDVDGTLLTLSSILTQLGPDQPVYGFKPRWINGLGGAYSSVAEAAREYLTEVRTLQPNGPYLLGGDCVNGIVAFEMAQQLRREGEEVALLVLLDTAHPSMLGRLIADVRNGWRRVKHIAATIREIVHADNSRKKSLVHNLVRRKLGLSAGSSLGDSAGMDNHLYKKEFRRAMNNYRPTPYGGRITLIVNENVYRIYGDLGWNNVGTGGITIHQTRGTHSTRLTTYRKELAQLLLSCIDEVVSENAGEPNPSREDAA
jgi:amino acid adenylation domain-containing protein